MDEQEHEIRHDGHRQRIRDYFSEDSSDTVLMELLLNGYFARSDTNYAARSLMRSRTAAQLLQTAAGKNPSAVSGIQYYLGISGELVSRVTGNRPRSQKLMEHCKDRYPELAELSAPYFLTDDLRILYLCFNSRHELIRILPGLLGESGLPLALQHCHIADLNRMVCAVSIAGVPEEELTEALTGYLDCIGNCPRNWQFYGVLLINGDACSFIRVRDDYLMGSPQQIDPMAEIYDD